MLTVQRTLLRPARFLWPMALCAALLPGCSGETSRAYHLLVISVGAMDDADLDALDPERHQNLLAWLQVSTRFAPVPAERPDGLTTVASQWTGLRAEEHGAGRDGERWVPLGADQTPMAEYLIEHSYNPGAILAGEPFYDPQYGLQQGFREYQWIPSGAEETALLGVDWIDSHVKQPFFCFVGLRSDESKAPAARWQEIDRALGRLLGALRRHGIFDSTLVIVTAHAPRTAGQGMPLLIKAPKQTQAARDARSVHPYHLPQLILQHAALPVAAVRPNSYLQHTLPAPQPSQEDATPTHDE